MDRKIDRGKAFVQVLSCVLTRLVAANDQVRAVTRMRLNAWTWPAPAVRPPHGLTICRLDLHNAPLLQQPDLSGVVTKFHALRPPSISIKDYLER